MSREIKFRLWEGEWYWHQVLVGGFGCDKDLQQKNFETCPLVWVKERDDWFNCDRGIIEQYTGLKDKNGVEIYEGDIIGRKDDDTKVSHHTIVYHDCGFMGKQNVSSGSYISLEHWTTGDNAYVVIGNIHENKELLLL